MVGNAMLCKIDPNTGELLSKKTFGSINYCTWISQFCIIQNDLWGVGFRQYTLENPSGLGWLIKLNPNSI